MLRPVIGLGAVCASVLFAAPAFGQNLPVAEALAQHVYCARDTMQAAVDSYLAAQEAGDAALLNRADEITYKESRAEADIAAGVLTQAIGVDFHHSLLDEYQCQTFTEIVDADGEHPYVLGVHLKLDKATGAITYIDTLVTDPGDWLFNAGNTLHWMTQEDWSAPAEPQRATRQELRNAANSYLDLFNDKTAEVPWAMPCRRLEGGAYTGDGSPDDSCEVGVPDGVAFPVRDYVIDTELSAIVALVPFGGEGGLPDSHLFRVVDGRITNVHTITVCREGQECPQIGPWDAPEAARPPE
jgi:hypothetical protein